MKKALLFLLCLIASFAALSQAIRPAAFSDFKKVEDDITTQTNFGVPHIKDGECVRTVVWKHTLPGDTIAVTLTINSYPNNKNSIATIVIETSYNYPVKSNIAVDNQLKKPLELLGLKHLTPYTAKTMNILYGHKKNIDAKTGLHFDEREGGIDDNSLPYWHYKTLMINDAGYKEPDMRYKGSDTTFTLPPVPDSATFVATAFSNSFYASNGLMKFFEGMANRPFVLDTDKSNEYADKFDITILDTTNSLLILHIMVIKVIGSDTINYYSLYMAATENETPEAQGKLGSMVDSLFHYLQLPVPVSLLPPIINYDDIYQTVYPVYGFTYKVSKSQSSSNTDCWPDIDLVNNYQISFSRYSRDSYKFDMRHY